MFISLEGGRGQNFMNLYGDWGRLICLSIHITYTPIVSTKLRYYDKFKFIATIHKLRI